MVEFANRINNVEEYYFSKKLQEVRSLDSPEFPVINLGIGSPDQPPSADTIKELNETASASGSHGYQSYKGIPALREGIANFYNKVYGVTLDPERMILPLMGSKEGIMHISMAFVNEGDVVLIPDPGYPTYASVSQLVGARIETYSLTSDNDWQIDIEDLERRDLSKVKIMWINTPHMPTGSILNKSTISRLINLAKRHNFLLVNDNPYSLILNDHPQSILSREEASEVCLELNSLSKSHNMPGWRVGWLAGKSDYIDAVLKVKSNMDSGMFLGIQKAAAQALKLPDKWFDELNQMYLKRRTEAYAILDLLGCTYSKSQVGLFVWAKAPKEVESEEKWIDKILYECKVFITPGFIFGNGGNGYIRISLCATHDKLREAKERLSAWMSATKKSPSLLNEMK